MAFSATKGSAHKRLTHWSGSSKSSVQVTGSDAERRSDRNGSCNAVRCAHDRGKFGDLVALGVGIIATDPVFSGRSLRVRASRRGDNERAG